MRKVKLRALSALMLVVMLFSLLTGCSQGGASTAAEVGEKLELAIKYLSESNYEQAILAYQDVIEIDPKQVMAYKGISLAYALQDKMDEAEQALQDGLKAIPGSQEITLTLAGLLVDLERNDVAEKLYKELIEKDDTYLPALKAYTSYLQTNGRNAEAIKLLESAAGKSDHYSLDTLLASQYMKIGETEAALAMIKASLQKEPGQVEAYNLLVDLYADDLQGLLAFADEYTVRNSMTGSLLKLAVLYQMQDYEGLLGYYDNLLQDIKNSPKALCLAAKANLELGYTDKASGLMNLIQADAINDALLLAEIAQYYLDAGEKDKARLIAKAGIRVDGSSAENLLVLYSTYDNAGKSEAIQSILRYLLQSIYGIENTLNKLNSLGINLGDFIDSALCNKVASSKAVSILFDSQDIASIQQHQGNGFSFNLSGYWDQTNGTVYMCFLFCDTDNDFGLGWVPTEQQLWRNVVFRTKKYRVHSVEEYREYMESRRYGYRDASEFNRMLSRYDDYELTTWFEWERVHPCFGLIPGNIPLEEHMNRAGIPLDSVIFVDID